MNIKEITSKKLFKEYEVQIPYAEVDDSINNKINEITPTISLPGFRKGKAPFNIVKKKYENNILSEVIQKIVQDKTKKLLDDKNLKTYRQPKVEIKKYQKNEPVEIGIKIDLEPEINVFPFNKIELTKYSIQLDKQTINDNYKSFLGSQKTYKKVDSNRAIKNTDRVFVNIVTKDSSVPDFLKSQQNLPIVTDSDYQVLPDISKKLISKKVKSGDKIKLLFNLNDVLKEKNKTEVEFEIEVLFLEENIEFNIDADFLRKNNFKDEKDLQDKLKKNLIKQYDEYLVQLEKKELMDMLDKKNNFDIPEGIFDEEFQSIWHRLEHAKRDKQLDVDDKDLTEDQLRTRYKKIALRRVKLAILMQHIANNEKIEVSEKELTEGMLNYASQYPGQEKQIIDYFKQNPSSIDSIKGPIFENKIINHILSKIKQTKKNITVKEFKKLQENSFTYNKED